MAIDATASEATSIAGALTPAPSPTTEPPAPYAPDAQREEKLKIFERCFRMLWPTPDPKIYIATSIERYARRQLANQRDPGFAAQDVVQDAFVALYEAWFDDVPPKPFPKNDEEFKALVFSTVRNRAHNYRRDASVLRRWLAKVFSERPTRLQRWIFGYPDAHPFLDAVVEASEHLPPKTRHVFREKWVQGYKRNEIAASMAIQVSTVDWHLRDANARLQGLLVDYTPERDENWILALDRAEEIAFPESSTNVKDRTSSSPRGMPWSSITRTRDESWKDPERERQNGRRPEPSRYSLERLEERVHIDEPLSVGGVIALHEPIRPRSWRLLGNIIQLVTLLPDLLYWFSAGRESRAARVGRALTDYLAGDARPEIVEAAEETLLADPLIVEFAGPLLMAWQMSPARTREAEVDVAWAEFQQRVGLSTAPPPREAVARIEGAARLRREFMVKHPRNRRWVQRLSGLLMLSVGAVVLGLAGMLYVSQGKTPMLVALADGGFCFVLMGLFHVQRGSVQALRRSRGLLFGIAGTAVVLTMDLIAVLKWLR